MMSYIVERLIANWEILRNKYCLRENELRPVSVCVNIALYDSMYYVVAGIKSPIINICTPYMQDSPSLHYPSKPKFSCHWTVSMGKNK